MLANITFTFTTTYISIKYQLNKLAVSDHSRVIDNLKLVKRGFHNYYYYLQGTSAQKLKWILKQKYDLNCYLGVQKQVVYALHLGEITLRSCTYCASINFRRVGVIITEEMICI